MRAGILTGAGTQPTLTGPAEAACAVGAVSRGRADAPVAEQRARTDADRRDPQVDSRLTSSVGRITAAGSSPPIWASSTRTISLLIRSHG